MTVKQKATKWLAHFALAVTLVMGAAATTGNAEASKGKAIKKILEKITKPPKGTVRKAPSGNRKKKRRMPNASDEKSGEIPGVVIWGGRVLHICRLEAIRCRERLEEAKLREEERDSRRKRKAEGGRAKGG